MSSTRSFVPILGIVLPVAKRQGKSVPRRQGSVKNQAISLALSVVADHDMRHAKRRMSNRLADPQGLTTRVNAVETKGSWLAWCDLRDVPAQKGETEIVARTKLYAAIVAARDRRVPRTTGVAELPRTVKKRKG